ncbi:MAG: GNAT family N-acetyltransferase [Thermomicrobiales bacterium]
MRSPRVGEIADVARTLAVWDRSDPLGSGLRGGDFGWMCRNGDAWMAEKTLIWEGASGDVVAIGVREGSDGIWVQLDPACFFDSAVAQSIVDGVQEAGIREVSGPAAPSALRAELAERGATIDPDLWPHLWRPLTDADLIETPGVLSTNSARLVKERITVQRSAFVNSTFTREKWEMMAAGPLFRPELDLILTDESGAGVSALTAWLSADAPCGVIEPMGTHRDHWRRGYGSRVLRASFSALRRLGADGVRVFAERGNAGAIATYTRVGFRVVGYDATFRLGREGTH